MADKPTSIVAAILMAVPVVPLEPPMMRVFGEVDAGLRQRGKTRPTSDVLIGWTALYRNDAVVTGSVRHFEQIPGLVVHRLG